MHKDINFFSVQKNIQSKASGFRSIILICIVFILIIGLAFGIINLLKFNYSSKINSIKKSMNTKELNDAKAKIDFAGKKQELMQQYNSALTIAATAYNKSFKIDKGIFESITSSMPDDVTSSQITVNIQSITLTCKSTNILSPANFTQALKSKGIFSSVSYDGVAEIKEEGKYGFNMICVFKEAAIK